ncbi:NAD(P)-dependent oxidoreductase [Enterobacter sp. ENT02]|uniref:NAD-dependent epimerase/dehydratase family protein n=1 Tax=Enterobacter sp. ENT02 TaxID=2854767 RepID=UPI001C494587|nr:NAD(P)-dependent oxidoreductase [Enterobacter sp. ENT02]MBV7557229.1 NAD(P)-dependent oxidoreductase [Enterobacter sp. ENT02]
MSNNKITVFGSGGFIGSAVFARLDKAGFQVEKGDWQCNDFSGQSLGTVIYCCGVGDCKRTEDVIYSHVDALRNIINSATYDKIVYVSSTRVYLNNDDSAETSALRLSFDDKRCLFNQAKLLGESVALAQEKPCLIVRPSNVYGKAFNSPLFLPSLVRDAITKGEINLFVSPDYEKDYVYIDDLVDFILNAVQNHVIGTYNIASGENVSAKKLVQIIEEYTQCSSVWHPVSSEDIFPVINIDKYKSLDFSPRKVESLLIEMIHEFRKQFA